MCGHCSQAFSFYASPSGAPKHQLSTPWAQALLLDEAMAMCLKQCAVRVPRREDYWFRSPFPTGEGAVPPESVVTVKDTGRAEGAPEHLGLGSRPRTATEFRATLGKALNFNGQYVYLLQNIHR